MVQPNAAAVAKLCKTLPDPAIRSVGSLRNNNLHTEKKLGIIEELFASFRENKSCAWHANQPIRMFLPGAQFHEQRIAPSALLPGADMVLIQVCFGKAEPRPWLCRGCRWHCNTSKPSPCVKCFLLTAATPMYTRLG